MGQNVTCGDRAGSTSGPKLWWTLESSVENRLTRARRIWERKARVRRMLEDEDRTTESPEFQTRVIFPNYPKGCEEKERVIERI